MRSLGLRTAAILAATFLPAWAEAAPILPTSYDMLNGNSGWYNYWDQIYTGAGCVTCDNSPLSGGQGDLTDGIIAADNWFDAEFPAGNGPYVGWALDPLITFHFAPGTTIDSLTIYVDDADSEGGVSLPSGVRINGQLFSIGAAPGAEPKSFTFGDLNVTGDVGLELLRSGSWVFLSEVQFDSGTPTAVPEPMSLTLLGSGLAALAGKRLRRKR
jgi:hypothetical protein